MLFDKGVPMLLADIGDSVQRGANEVGDWVPNLLAALAILVVGYIVARVLAGMVVGVLHRAGADRRLGEGAGGSLLQRVAPSPSRLLGSIVFWVVLLGAATLAVEALGIAGLESFMGEVYAYLPNVLAALLIFVVASLLAAGIAGFARRVLGDTGLGRLVAVAAPILVVTIATFMILDQLRIAETIVTITYAALIGAIALGSALAFGLGGRDVAARMLEGAYQTGRVKKDEFRRDLDTGISRARAEREAPSSEQATRVEAPAASSRAQAEEAL
jgi:hypothetical protein